MNKIFMDKGIRVYRKGEESFFDPLTNCLAGIAGVLIALEAFSNSGFTKAAGDPKYYLSFAGKELGLHWECHDLMLSIATNSWPSEIIFHENIPVQESNKFIQISTGFPWVLAANIQAAFLWYYESQIQTIKNKYGDNPIAWPNEWDFGRVVRNSVAHGGKINITNSNSPIVRWRDFGYSARDNGREVIFKDLGFVEFVILMEEMERQLITS